MSNFVAHFVYSDSDGNSVKAGLADAQYDTTRYILFERLKEPTEQDLKFEMELPYVEIDDQGQSGYGVVERIVLKKKVLSVWFSEEGSRTMGLETREFEVAFHQDLEMNDFEKAMAWIFADKFTRGD